MAIGTRDLGILAAGVVIGLVPAGFLMLGGGAAEEAGEFEAYVAEEVPAEEEESGGRRVTGMTPSECEETLEAVRQAHADALKRYSANQEVVDHLTNLVERSGLGAPEGLPIDFPGGLDEEFQPENFDGLMAELKNDCPEIFGGATWDCVEYPCIVEFTTAAEGFDHRRVSQSCPAVADRLGQMTRTFHATMDGEPLYHMLAMGRGEGMSDFWQENSGNLNRRGNHRYQQRLYDIVTERHDDACMLERDGAACLRMGQASWWDPELQATYFELGCDFGDAGACYAMGNTMCNTYGRCDATALEYAKRAVLLDSEPGLYHQLVGTILCQMGQAAEADASFETACAQGRRQACERTCHR